MWEERSCSTQVTATSNVHLRGQKPVQIQLRGSLIIRRKPSHVYRAETRVASSLPPPSIRQSCELVFELATRIAAAATAATTTPHPLFPPRRRPIRRTMRLVCGNLSRYHPFSTGFSRARLLERANVQKTFISAVRIYNELTVAQFFIYFSFSLFFVFSKRNRVSFFSF